MYFVIRLSKIQLNHCVGVKSQVMIIFEPVSIKCTRPLLELDDSVIALEREGGLYTFVCSVNKHCI